MQLFYLPFIIIGNLIITSVPIFYSDLISILPECSLKTLYAIDNPNPVPCPVSLAVKKAQ